MRLPYEVHAVGAFKCGSNCRTRSAGVSSARPRVVRRGLNCNANSPTPRSVSNGCFAVRTWLEGGAEGAPVRARRRCRRAPCQDSSSTSRHDGHIRGPKMQCGEQICVEKSVRGRHTAAGRSSCWGTSGHERVRQSVPWRRRANGDAHTRPWEYGDRRGKQREARCRKRRRDSEWRDFP